MRGRKKLNYGIYDQKDHGCLVFLGTVEECAAYLSRKPQHLYMDISRRTKAKGRYLIEKVSI